MHVYLPNDFHQEKIVLLFQFEDSDGNKFGDPLIGIIDVDISDEDLFAQSNQNKERKNSIKSS